MIKLTPPTTTGAEALKECIKGIDITSELRTNTIASKKDFNSLDETYKSIDTFGGNTSIKSITSYSKTAKNVIGRLSHEDLVKLYEDHLSNNKKSARTIYDSILLAAEDNCPYCGGLTEPSTLDHYLPKSQFPQYSIVPINLIPACYKCNLECKKSAFTPDSTRMTLHAYLDDDLFFNTQWIYCRLHGTINNNDLTPQYFTHFTTAWTPTQKSRAIQHYTTFNIRKRYALAACREINRIRDEIIQLRTLKLTDTQIQSFLHREINQFTSPNNWRRGLYQSFHDGIKSRTI